MLSPVITQWCEMTRALVAHSDDETQQTVAALIAGERRRLEGKSPRQRQDVRRRREAALTRRRMTNWDFYFLEALRQVETEEPMSVEGVGWPSSYVYP